MRHMTRWLSCGALFVCAAVAAAQVPDPKTGATIQGKVRPVAQDLLLLQPGHASQRTAVTQKIRALLDIVQRTPAFSPPIGLDISPGLLARTPLIGVNRDIVQYEVSAGFLWYTIVSGNTIIPQFVSMVGFHVHANHISLVFEANEAWVEDGTKQTYWEPRQVAQEAGHPYYHTHTIVMKKTDRPIWIPLTKEQVLTRMLANARKAQAELPAEAEARVRNMATHDVSCLDAALSGLSAADRAATAYLTLMPPRPPECSPLVDPKTPQARRLVTENPAFYDTTLSPSEIQMIVLSFRSIQYPPRAWQRAVVETLRKGMDYTALANMIAGGR